MLADAIARPLSIILERSWQSGERKKGKCHGHFQEGQGGASRELLAYQPNLSPQKIMEPVFLEAMSKHMKDRKVTRNSQHGCTMGRLCLTSLTTFCGEMTGSVDGGSTVDVVYLDCSMALHSLP